MARNKRLFLVIWLAAMAGVLSFLLVDIDVIARSLPVPEGMPPPELPPAALLKLAAIFQPAVLVSVAVIIGIWLAPKVGLHAPAAEAFADRESIWPALRPQIIPGIAGGIVCGIAIVATWIIAKPLMPSEFVTKAVEFNKFIPHAVRILYGGFTEEILIRWGVMTFLVWLLWRIFQRGHGDVRPVFVIGAILISAILFGAGHLPIAAALSGGLTLSIIVYVIVANSLFGIAAGFLYWRRGLEAAMIAHMFAHVVLIASIASGL
jgi:hypothetical protein